MRLLSFAVRTPVGRFERLGARLGDRWIDLHGAALWHALRQGWRPERALAWALHHLPPDMLAFLEQGEEGMALARHLLGELTKLHDREGVWPEGHEGATLAFEPQAVEALSPLPRPRALRDFYAFEEHVATGFAKRQEPIPPAWYQLPVSYKGNPRTVVGPEALIPWPDYAQVLDFELELALVIGKAGQDLHPDQALDHVAGLTVMNDLSARDVQRLEMACRLGPAKGKDFATQLGPELVTLDELPSLVDLPCAVRVNGELWTQSNAGRPHWALAELVAHASRGEAILPGDLLATGTVGRGCGLELDRYPQPGDRLELSIEGLGALACTLGPKPSLLRPLGERLSVAQA